MCGRGQCDEQCNNHNAFITERHNNGALHKPPFATTLCVSFDCAPVGTDPWNWIPQDRLSTHGRPNQACKSTVQSPGHKQYLGPPPWSRGKACRIVHPAKSPRDSEEVLEDRVLQPGGVVVCRPPSPVCKKSRKPSRSGHRQVDVQTGRRADTGRHLDDRRPHVYKQGMCGVILLSSGCCPTSIEPSVFSG